MNEMIGISRSSVVIHTKDRCYICFTVLALLMQVCVMLCWLRRSRDVKRFVMRLMYLLDIFYNKSHRFVSLLYIKHTD